MTALVNIRALHRSSQVRVKNSAGDLVALTSTAPTTVDLDDPAVRVMLGHHHAIGQYVTDVPLVSGNYLSTTTTSTQTVNSSITLAAEKRLTLSCSGVDNGSVTRLIEFHAATIVDRPWQSYFDYTGRHSAAWGAHDTLPVSEGGAQLKQWEVKTIASATGPDPTELRTRLGIQYDVQRGIWGVNFIDYFEINQGENPILTTPGSATATGLRIRTTDSTGHNTVVAQLIATIDGTDNVTANLDVMNTGVSTTKTANLIIGRNTNTSSSSGAIIFIKRMDGSNTNVVQINPRTSPPAITFGYAGDTGFDFVVGSDTGLKIATATTQKLGFFNTTPVVQPSTTGTTTGFTANAGTTVNSGSTFTGNTGTTAYTVGDMVAALKTLGLIAA